ncbi:hypothetical protein EMIT0P44_280068 [Pseudomonas sp. IT-P44]
METRPESSDSADNFSETLNFPLAGLTGLFFAPIQAFMTKWTSEQYLALCRSCNLSVTCCQARWRHINCGNYRYLNWVFL